jgi:glutathione S-transferase
MKVNHIQWDRIKVQWDMSVIASALATMLVGEDGENIYDPKESKKPSDKKALLMERIKHVKFMLEKSLEEEEYLMARDLTNLLEKMKEDLNGIEDD